MLMSDFYSQSHIAETIPKWHPHKVSSLKLLHLLNINFGDLGQLQAALFMLRNSPNLEQLCLTNMHVVKTTAKLFIFI